MPASPAEPSPPAALAAPSSGKTARDENFPVASFLIAPALRPHVMRFYAFARAADDIADAPDLTAEEKLARLDAMEQALTGNAPPIAAARSLRESLAETGIGVRHPRQLLAAFRQDATKHRYANWQELLDYCTLSANPVGRYLLDLHGESYDALAPADALCTALQILNHLQDCQDDYRQLDRVYLPQDWLAEAGATIEDLDGPAATPPLRHVLDRCLDRCEVLLREAEALPAEVLNIRLSAESETIIALAQRLARRLRRQDPLAARVRLSKTDFLLAGAYGVARAFFRPLVRHWRAFR